VPTVLKSGSLNLLEPSGPVQAWNGIALTFTHYIGGEMGPTIGLNILENRKSLSPAGKKRTNHTASLSLHPLRYKSSQWKEIKSISKSLVTRMLGKINYCCGYTASKAKTIGLEQVPSECVPCVATKITVFVVPVCNRLRESSYYSLQAVIEDETLRFE
jgi:hypothetical protein